MNAQKPHLFIVHAFRAYSIRHALRTLLPTIKEQVWPTVLPANDRIALCSMTMHPLMATVWYHFAKKSVGDTMDIVIVDSSGALKESDVPGAIVLPYLNVYAATKAEHLLHTTTKHRTLVWLCDDDMFLNGTGYEQRIREEFAKPNTAALSFEPRPWWHFEIDGNEYEPSSTYALVLDRTIVTEKEKLSIKPTEGNTHPTHVAMPSPRRYDSFDKANETLLEKGYRCAVIPEQERRAFTMGFDSVSNGVALVTYCKSAEEVLTFFTKQPEKNWKGKTLHRILAGLLSLSYIRLMSEEIQGNKHAIATLPSHEDILDLAHKKEDLLTEGRTFAEVQRTGQKLLELAKS